MNRPYGAIGNMINYNYTMNMVWHDDKFIQRNVVIMHRYFQPSMNANISEFVQCHMAINNVAKQTFMVLGANGHVIGAGL